MVDTTAALDKQPQLNYNERQAVGSALKLIPGRFPAISKVILYGSKARGDFLEDSDMDLLFIVDRPMTKETKYEIYDMLYESEVEYDVVISAVFVGREALDARPSPFMRRALKEGITLWSKG